MSTMRRANVVRVSDSGVWVTIPSLGGPDAEWGPLPRTPMEMEVGDRVIVAQVGGELESFVAVAPLKQYLTNQRMIYFFEDEAARDALFPGPNPVPTFVWIDDLATLQVWTDEGTPHWETLSDWDEARIADIETEVSSLDSRVDVVEGDVATHETRLDTVEGDVLNLFFTSVGHDTRLDTIEAGYVNAVTDTATVDLTLTGSGPKTISGAVIPSGLVSADANNHLITGSDSKLFTHKELIVCTSGTRPGSPTQGQMIYETDHDLVRLWTGSTWRQMTPWRLVNTVASNTASVTVNIPSALASSLRNLTVRWQARSTDAAAGVYFLMRINGNSGANYTHNYTIIQGGSPIHGGSNETFWRIGLVGGAGAADPTKNFGKGIIHFPMWSGSGWLNSNWQGHFWENPVTSYYTNGGGLFFVDGPYTSVRFHCLAGNILAGSRFELEGWE